MRFRSLSWPRVPIGRVFFAYRWSRARSSFSLRQASARKSASTRSTPRPATASATARSTSTPARKSSEIDEFVPRSEIDELYYMRPYYIVPDGDVGQEAFAVIRESIAKMDKVAIGRVVLTTREHVIVMEPRGKGLMGTLLRYPYEVRDEKEYFDDIPNIKVKKDMLDLAQHIVETKSGHFEPESFEDHYETALRELIEKKSKGIKIEAPKRGEPAKVINLMDALRKSIRTEQVSSKKPAKAKRGKKRIEGQREMLFSISGKKPAKEAARKTARASGRRKAG